MMFLNLSLCNFSKKNRYTHITNKDTMGLVTIEEAKSMIGKKVKALGVCGITEGVTIVGILDRLEHGDAIVKISHGKKEYSLPCLANKNTLELVNGSCGHCDNALSDAEAFNQVCFECGKKV
jgi:hypothetical protein